VYEKVKHYTHIMRSFVHHLQYEFKFGFSAILWARSYPAVCSLKIAGR